jgi:hypothetical protein
MLRVSVLVSVLAGGCRKDEPLSTPAPTDDAATRAPVATPAPSASGAASPRLPAGTFVKFFPGDGDKGIARVVTADRAGYAEAKLRKDGSEIAVLAISDAERSPFTKAKFEESTDKLEGFPLLKVGNEQTSLLVKGRYQVKVTSPTLDHEGRKAILKTFDLKGLDAL